MRCVGAESSHYQSQHSKKPEHHLKEYWTSYLLAWFTNPHRRVARRVEKRVEGRVAEGCEPKIVSIKKTKRLRALQYEWTCVGGGEDKSSKGVSLF